MDMLDKAAMGFMNLLVCWVFDERNAQEFTGFYSGVGATKVIVFDTVSLSFHTRFPKDIDLSQDFFVGVQEIDLVYLRGISLDYAISSADEGGEPSPGLIQDQFEYEYGKEVVRYWFYYSGIAERFKAYLATQGVHQQHHVCETLTEMWKLTTEKASDVVSEFEGIKDIVDRENMFSIGVSYPN